MVQLFFLWDGKMKIVNISPETHERLRLYLYSSKIVSSQEVLGQVHKKFGDVSEELILRYLDELN